MNYVRAFVAAFISTLVFHQAVIGLFYLMGALPRAPWALTPTEPFGVPQVISLAFWGGIWGIVLWPVIRGATGSAYWVRSILFGAIAPTAVAYLVVAPLKGMAFGMGWDPKLWIGGLIVNAAWGFGLALLLRWLRRVGI